MVSFIIYTLIVSAYLIGSISFAWLVARAKGINLREHGSGNLGATNVGRVLGGRYFALVFVADFIKGFLPVFLMQLWLSLNASADGPSPSSWWQVAAAAAAVIGHIFPCWHGFKGGKAVATSLGVVIAISPIVAASAFAVWLVVWFAGKLGGLKSSAAVGPASILAATAAIIFQWYWFALNDPYTTNTTLVTVAGGLILIRHRSNLQNILRKRQNHTPGAVDSNNNKQTSSEEA